ncbi:MAG: CHAT domain-containing tetratricopeptide repeat protein [Candidatus Zixiibacteriota bacterium]
MKRSTGHPSVVRLAAYRSLARAAHLSARHREALRAYLNVRRLHGGNRLGVAKVDRALIDIYMYLGNFSESRRKALLAVRAFKNAGALSDVAMTQVNLANVLHRQDRHRDAEKLYRSAAEHFRKTADAPALARCLYNRANTLVQLFRMDEAEQSYDEAERIYTANGFTLEATDARYGLAWLRMLSGKFHVALTDLAECESIYRQMGQPKGAALCELDRAEVYLGLNLFSDAREAARMAERSFRKLGLRYELAKACLFRAKAALALGYAVEGKKTLAAAQTRFKAEKNNGFLGATLLARAQISDDRREQLSALVRARRQFERAQLPLWEAVCDLHEAASSRDARRPLRRLARNGAAQQVPHLFAGWQTLAGDIAYGQGKKQQARTHWQIAAERLDAVRAQLPPIEMRSTFSRLPGSPHRKLVASFLDDDPAIAAVWSERYRTAGIWTPLVDLVAPDQTRQRAENSLVQLANQVAQLSRQIGGVAGERSASTLLPRAVARLQRDVRMELSRAERNGGGQVDSIERLLEQFAAASRMQPVVQFHQHEADIVAFIHEHGTTRVHRFQDGGNRLMQSMREWRFLLEGELLSQQLGAAIVGDQETPFFESLGEWLWRPLEVPKRVPRVLIIPEGDLANLPWQALRVGGEPLLDRHDFVVTPSIRHFSHAKEIIVKSSEVGVFVGPAQDLPEVSRELQTLQESTTRPITIHDPSCRQDWPATGEASVWHFSGHAHLRADNPFYSFLALADGPLFAADFRLKDVKVHLVTLAACRSGQQVALPGEETSGLVRSLLEMGARNVIAGHWPVSDRSTALWMSTFYNTYFVGNDILAAARRAATVVREQYPSAYHWAAFSVFGAGN